MSSIFKTLASITALLLFIVGSVGLVSRVIVWFDDIGFTGTDTSQLAIDFFVIIALFVASVVVMRLRQKIE